MSFQNEFSDTGLRVAVLCGGDSTEREVSLVSGKSVVDAIESAGMPCDLFELEQNALPRDLDHSTHLVLPVIHGKYGEDGCLSSELDRAGFAYAGCQQAASVLCYDKLASKSIAVSQGIPVANDLQLYPESRIEFDKLVNELGIPFILKPRLDGSSVGLYLVDDESTYAAARSDLEKTDYLAEKFVDGIDLTVGILGCKALGVVAILPEGGLYDYQHKYTTGMSQYLAPADIEKKLAEQLQEWSEIIFRSCGCRDLARVDYRMTSTGEIIFLEINTIPGMTPTSLLPKSAQCSGISFTELVLTWIGFAFERFKETH
jgi:D-alanine-D-alanine ligase